MTQIDKKAIKIEIKSRKIISKKLTTAINALSKTALRNKADRERRIAELSEYKNEDEIQEAYGWGYITEEEYSNILDAYRNGTEQIASEISAEEIAVDMLKGWLKIMSSDIQDLEFQLLPEKEKNRILEENYRIAQEREKRRKEREEKAKNGKEETL